MKRMTRGEVHLCLEGLCPVCHAELLRLDVRPAGAFPRLYRCPACKQDFSLEAVP